MRELARRWARAVPAAVILVSLMAWGQISGGLHHPAPNEFITEPAIDLTP